MDATDNHDKTVPLVLQLTCERNAGRVALKDSHQTLTYSELYAKAGRLKAGFSRLGVGRSENVLVMLDNHVDYALNWFGLNFAGAVEVPVNTAYRGTFLAHVAADSGAELAVIESHYYDMLASVKDQVPTLKRVVIRGSTPERLESRWEHISFEGLFAAEPEESVDVKPWDPAAILYTSGTTGVSKGVIVPHALAYSDAHPEYTIGARQGDTVLVAMPLFHGGAHWMVYNALIVGATAYIVPKFHATNFWEIAREHGCTFTWLIGAMANFLYRQPPHSSDRDHPMKRVLMVPVIPEVEDFTRRFGVQVGNCYGLTEGGNPILGVMGKAVPNGCGWIRPDYEARLVDESDYDVPLGSVGELLLRPKLPWTTMLGYHGLPQKTNDVWRNLWLHTGDLMTQDPAGQFFFIDRLKDAIRRRGENVSSYEVEREINTHPNIMDCAVFGVESEHSEQEIKVAVVLKTGLILSPADLIAYLEPRLPHFMMPRYIEFVDDLPRTPNQKVQKQALRERWLTTQTWDRMAQHGSEAQIGSDATRRD